MQQSFCLLYIQSACCHEFLLISPKLEKSFSSNPAVKNERCCEEQLKLNVKTCGFKYCGFGSEGNQYYQ